MCWSSGRGRAGCSPRPGGPTRGTGRWWGSGWTRWAAAPPPTTSTGSRSTTARSSSRPVASPSRPAARSGRRSTSASPGRRCCTGSGARTGTSPGADGQVGNAVLGPAGGGQSQVVRASVVVSDIGPAGTVRLAGPEFFGDEYLASVKRADRPAAMISVNFASQERLIDVPSMLSFAVTRRLAYMANFTDLCPEMAPPGWNLYVAAGVPQPSVGDFDEAAETDRLFADIDDVIPGFGARARVLSTVVTRDDWPPQRAVAGFDLAPATPIANLWNVGDGVKEYANGGTTACAETAQLVADQIIEGLQPG